MRSGRHARRHAALFLLDRQAVRAEMEVHALGQLVLPIEMIGDRGEDDRQRADDQVKNNVASHTRHQIAPDYPSDMLFGRLSPRGVSRVLDFPIDPAAARAAAAAARFIPGTPNQDFVMCAKPPRGLDRQRGAATRLHHYGSDHRQNSKPF